MGKLKKREELKQLKSLKDRLNGKISGLELQQDQIKNELATLRADLQSVDVKIKALSEKKDLIMTEHAILRYFERVLKIDVDDFVKNITQDENLIDYVQTLGDGHYPVRQGSFRVVVRDNSIVTVITEDMK